MLTLVKMILLPVIVALIGVAIKGFITPALGDLERQSLTGKTFLITGATSGLGQSQAEVLHNWGASLVLPVRNMEKGHKFARQLMQSNPDSPEPVIELMDLHSLASVRSFAEKYRGPVDVLVHNAAVLGTGELRRTGDGFEECLQVNYLSSVLLTSLLLDRVEASPAGRVVFVSAKAHEMANISIDAMRKEKVLGPDFPSRQNLVGNLGGSYADSKLAQILFSTALNRRLKKPAVSHSLHPAITFETNLVKGVEMNAFLRSIIENVGSRVGQFLGGVQSEEDAPKMQIHVSTHPALQAVGGRYYSSIFPPLTNCGKPAADCGLSDLSAVAADMLVQEEIFKASCDVLGLQSKGGLCDRQAK